MWLDVSNCSRNTKTAEYRHKGDSMKQSPDYACWIPKKLLTVSGGAGIALAVLFALSFLLAHSAAIVVLRVVLGVSTLLCLLFFSYMCIAYRMLSYEGGGVQGKVLDNVLHSLPWDGSGTLLDIGCGSGALAVKAAKKYPRAQITGVDYWGEEWDYAQSQCENNARIEGVGGRIRFHKQDAAKLQFPDAAFDAAVSNFVFHEVKSQPDKLLLIREALRVVKPGGAFCFEDVYFSKHYYPDLDGLLKALSGDVSELHFVDARKNKFVPSLLKTPMILGNMGLLYGKK